VTWIGEIRIEYLKVSKHAEYRTRVWDEQRPPFFRETSGVRAGGERVRSAAAPLQVPASAA